MSKGEPWPGFYQEVHEVFKPAPPKPKRTQEEKAQAHWQSNKHGEAYAEQAASSLEAFARNVETETAESRRQKAMTREITEWNEAGKDPHVRYQRELDRIAQANLDLKTALELEDEYVEIGGFRERRYGKSFHRGNGDPDYGL